MAEGDAKAADAQQAGTPPEGDWGGVVQNLESTLQQIWDSLVGHTPFIAAGLFVLVVTAIVARVVKRFAGGMFERAVMRDSLRQLLSRLLGIGVWIVGSLIVATLWFPGMTPAGLLGGVGLLSVAVGFAFQDIFENFFAGILLLWRFPFEDGDFIQCEGIEGRVERVNVRMTEIRETSGELVLVPNSLLFKNPVEILTDKPVRRVTILCGIGYGEDVSEGVSVIRNAVEGCDTVNRDSHPIQVFPQAFGSSSIDIEVAWWTKPRPVDVRESRAQVVTAIKKALDDAGIEIPFPYRTLTFSEPLALDTQSGRESET